MNKTYKPGVTCTAIMTHHRIHDDEAAGIAFLKYYGNAIHPGIVDAIENESFIFADAGSTSYEKKSWEKLHADGIVCVGVMGSPYDEHFLPDELRGNECSATLIAKALEVDKGLGYEKLLAGLLKSDRESEGDILSFSSHIKRGHMIYAKGGLASAKKMLTYCMQPFEWMMECQNRFFNETCNEFKKKAMVERIRYNGRDIVVALIQSDDEQIASLAKSHLGAKANVVICKNSNGHVYISTSKFPFIDLSPAARLLKIEEMEMKGMRYNPFDSRLEEDGIMLGLEEWCFQKEAQRIFNGSLSAPGKQKTRIPLGRIYGLVLTALKSSNAVNKNSKQAVIKKMAS